MQQGKSEILPMTDSNGRPVTNNQDSLTAGPSGPILLQDTHLIEKLAHFNRERVPERVVHAKGAGAHGYLEITQDVSKYCKAKLFTKVGTKVPAFVRFSSVIPERGGADSRRDPRGFAVKFYTEEGNWDVVGNDVPIFFINDPIKFPDMIHAFKRNPQTNINDPNTFWDFVSLSPEATHMISMIFSDRGTPASFRMMHGFGTHTFKWINEKDEVTFVKLHFKSNQGIKNFTQEEAERLEGVSPDVLTKDLFDTIQAGEFPSWRFCIQAMTEEQAANYKFNILDDTKIWPHEDFPLIEVGKLVLDRNPDNYHQEVEQSAFSPATLIDGMEPSADKMLQGRLFAYPDAQRYRIGANYQQLPINCPFMTRVANDQRDGFMAFNNQGNRHNYNPSSWGNYSENRKYKFTKFELEGMAGRYSNNVQNDHYIQARALFEKAMNDTDRAHLISNIVGNLKGAVTQIQERQCKHFFRVHVDYGTGVAKGLGLDVEKIKKEAEAEASIAPLVTNPKPQEKPEPVVGTLAPKAN